MAERAARATVKTWPQAALSALEAHYGVGSRNPAADVAIRLGFGATGRLFSSDAPGATGQCYLGDASFAWVALTGMRPRPPAAALVPSASVGAGDAAAAAVPGAATLVNPSAAGKAGGAGGGAEAPDSWEELAAGEGGAEGGGGAAGEAELGDVELLVREERRLRAEAARSGALGTLPLQAPRLAVLRLLAWDVVRRAQRAAAVQAACAVGALEAALTWVWRELRVPRDDDEEREERFVHVKTPAENLDDVLGGLSGVLEVVQAAQQLSQACHRLLPLDKKAAAQLREQGQRTAAAHSARAFQPFGLVPDSSLQPCLRAAVHAQQAQDVSGAHLGGCCAPGPLAGHPPVRRV